MTFQSDDIENLTATAKRLSQEICIKEGVVIPKLDLASVPYSIRPLLRHAEILGIGDDVARCKLFEVISKEYLRIVINMIKQCPEIYDWCQKSEATEAKHLPEVAAIGWMLIGLNLYPC